MSGRGWLRFFGHPLPLDGGSAGPVDGFAVPRDGLAVFGVPLWAVLHPFAFAVAVEGAVALAVDETFRWLGFVPADVVGFECCPVEVFVRVAVHGACAVFAFGAVDEVEQEVAAWHFVLVVAVATLCGGWLTHRARPRGRAGSPLVGCRVRVRRGLGGR